MECVRCKGVTQAGNYCNDCAQALVPKLIHACECALFLLGNDADREKIEPKPPWKPRLAPSVPGTIRTILAETR